MSVAANRVLRVHKAFAVERDGGMQDLRVVLFEGIDSGTLVRDWDFESIRFGDLASLTDRGADLTILLVDLDALDAEKRVELIAYIGRATALRAVALKDKIDAAECETLLRAGFAGVLQRDCSSETFLRAVGSVGEGQLWFPREIISRVLKGFLIEEDLSRLTSREIEIVRLIGSGLNNQQIADQLFISRETVRWHIRGLNAKLGTKDRHGLREYARYLRSSETRIPSASFESRRRSLAS